MEMSGEELINAPRSAVWAALNDPEMLKQAIPGCQSVDKEGDDSFAATVKVKVGPVKATFKGQVTLSNIDEPNGYTITGQGKGGPAGFGKGGADITLKDADGGTLLSYNVTASVGGKMAQIGSRLIDSTAKKLAGEFFSKFNELVSAQAGDISDTPDTDDLAASLEPADKAANTTTDAAPEATQQQATPAAEPEKAGWMKPSVLIPAAAVIALVLYFMTQGG